ncbi:PREDICTED: cystatin-B-like [Branchiostoma belcheri]|uniref:Cystatin-B-like n=1 Tax=Branchiostoma belcheri TaxID=7741 RepID=A0A6P5AZZ3_BRABE|nr:PREDICTED: cystatin-B-like [Branchiostoma belcheri]
MSKSDPGHMMMGGASGAQDATPEIQAICDEVKAEVEKQAGVKYRTFQAVSYRSQVVAGTNYFIKVDVGGEKYVHLTVFKGLPHNPGLKVSAVQLNKGKEDPL